MSKFNLKNELASDAALGLKKDKCFEISYEKFF
jgi:hypothetical protein